MSSDIAIRVEGLGKRYRIGGPLHRYKTLRETVMDGLARPFRRLGRMLSGDGSASGLTETIWALEDVSFEVARGEVMGIIGRNGAGKSTLLKVLARITEPTVGWADIFGRVSSLLEVGTGFHPELTGRDNIYLNGSILGMRRAEIGRRFDEIVDFAEISRFIDTPVKHYSSGMYVRLAFAVAAHLEPEILLVDEVLAVGDAAFQRKCLGKMGDVARQGRTILFVSHNMQAIQSLCGRAVMLDGGRTADTGPAHEVVARYLASMSELTSARSWAPGELGDESFSLIRLAVSGRGGTGDVLRSSDPVSVDIHFELAAPRRELSVGFDILRDNGEVVARSCQTDLAEDRWPTPRIGRNAWRCTIPPGLLNAGRYLLAPRVGKYNLPSIVRGEPAVGFEVVLDHGASPLWHALDHHTRPGAIAPIFEWAAVDEDA